MQIIRIRRVFALSLRHASSKVYSKTLNLPNAGNFKLTMKNIHQHEENVKKMANFDGLYKWQELNRSNKNEYILHDGPPYANGDIHIGHMVNKVLKDVLLRKKLLSGHKVNYQPGWDCHGLPIELNATKSIPEGQHDVLKIRSIARNFALKYIESQRKSFDKLDLLVDWSNIYRTINPEYICSELDLFNELYKKQLIFRDYMPVHWSISSQTALAEFEIEYNDTHKSQAVYVKYDLVDWQKEVSSVLKDNSKLSVLIWTTTPWSLPGNKAIAFNPDMQYDLLGGDNNQYYVVAHDLVSDIMNKLKLTNHGGFNINSLLNYKYKNPFGGICGFIESNHVNSKQGTGFVHIAPAFGFDDFKLAKKYQLETNCIIDEKGYYVNDERLGNFGLNGQNTLSSETMAKLDEILKDSIVHKHEYIHSYPYDWRTKKPLIIRASPQWFINTEKLRDRALEALSKVTIRPDNYENSMIASLKLKTYWCISRQRVWGVPIPCAYSGDNKPIVNDGFINKIKDLIRKDGNVDFWWSSKYDNELFKNGEQKSKDILDIWFDSGSSFNHVLQNKQQADVYCEGIDQFTGWFQSSLLLGIALNDKSPYKSLLVHGFVVDENNQKMSKSLGNVIEPWETLVGNNKKSLPQYGNDCMRFWVIHEYHKSRIPIGANILNNIFKRLFEIRSIFRFLIGNTNDFKTIEHIKYDQINPLDQYILFRLNSVIEQSKKHYDDLSLNKVLVNVEKFLLSDVSSFYLKSIKDRLYCEEATSLERQSAQYVLVQLLRHCCFILAPILPHLCEDIYLNSILKTSEQSIFQNKYDFEPCDGSAWNNEKIKTLFEVIENMREVFYADIPSENESLYEIKIKCNQELYDLINSYYDYQVSDDGDSRLNECFSNSIVKLILSNELDNSQKNKKYIFELECNKLVGHYQCARCRRYLNKCENALCKRCDRILNKVKLH